MIELNSLCHSLLVLVVSYYAWYLKDCEAGRLSDVGELFSGER